MENNNSVCFVGTVSEIQPIEGADRIELAIVNGWGSVVPVGQFFVHENVVCITTDAVIPEDVAETLGCTQYLRSGNRVRTVKLRGVYSECIIAHLDTLSVGHPAAGKDLQSVLGIFKYEPPEREVVVKSGNGKTKTVKVKDNRNFPIYYKFPNIKNVTNMFSGSDIVEITRKIHGTNFRAGIVKKNNVSLLDRLRRLFGNKWSGYEFVYGSHRVQKGGDKQGFYQSDVYLEAVEQYNIKEKLWRYVKHRYNPQDIGSGIVIFGEIYGIGIQGDHYTYGLTGEFGSNKRGLVVFDVTVDGEYLDVQGYRYISNVLEIPTVPELYVGPFDMEKARYYNERSYLSNKAPHEGVVIKSLDGDRRKIAKLINPEFLTFSEKFNVPDSH